MRTELHTRHRIADSATSPADEGMHRFRAEVSAALPGIAQHAARSSSSMPAAAPRQNCFASCKTCNFQSVGRWMPSKEPPPYRLNHSLWASMGLSGPPSSSSQHYGLCDDHAARSSKGPRALYEWETENCELPRFDRARACSLLRGKQIVVAGDSTAGQLFLSLVLLLGGSFGRNSRHTSAISDITASACADTCRLNFIRNDLLLWSTHRSEFNRARECDKLLKADGFVQRVVRDAHLLVLATGHHFPASIESAASGGGGQSHGGQAREHGGSGDSGGAISFFSSSLNHTLTNLMSTRASWGHAPASVALVGATIPVPMCSRFSAPLTTAGWLAADAHLSAGSKYSPRWRQMPRLNTQLQWLAQAFGASYVDVAAPSSRWPSGMMAGFTRGAGNVDEDCLHSCLPGPVDTWSRMLIESFIARRGEIEARRAGGGGTAGGAGGEGETGRRLRGRGNSPSATAASTSDGGLGTRTDGRRFFGVEAAAWLKERNSGAQFESCGGSRGTCVRAESSKQAWWPFTDCTRRRYLSFCEGGECRGPIRPGRAVISLCDGQGQGCRNVTVASLRAAAAHGLLRK